MFFYKRSLLRDLAANASVSICEGVYVVDRGESVSVKNSAECDINTEFSRVTYNLFE